MEKLLEVNENSLQLRCLEMQRSHNTERFLREEISDTTARREESQGAFERNLADIQLELEVFHCGEIAAKRRAAEVQTTSWWGPCAKRGLLVGIALFFDVACAFLRF